MVWLTVDGARAVVGVSRRTIYNWLRDGRLTTKRTAGGSLRILERSLWRETTIKVLRGGRRLGQAPDVSA